MRLPAAGGCKGAVSSSDSSNGNYMLATHSADNVHGQADWRRK